MFFYSPTIRNLLKQFVRQGQPPHERNRIFYLPSSLTKNKNCICSPQTSSAISAFVARAHPDQWVFAKSKRGDQTHCGGMVEESVYIFHAVCVSVWVRSSFKENCSQVVGLNSPTERTQTGRLTHAVTHKTDWLAHIALTSRRAAYKQGRPEMNSSW